MKLSITRRQIMINIMYGMVIVLLLLNQRYWKTSQSAITYVGVKKSLDLSSNTVEEKTNGVMLKFIKDIEDPKTHDKASLWFPKAIKAVELSHNLIKYLEGLQAELIKQSGVDSSNVMGYDMYNRNVSTIIFNKTNGKGKELINKINDYRNNMLAIDPYLAKDFGDLGLPSPMEENSFNKLEDLYNIPTIEVLTILSSCINCTRFCEDVVIEYFNRKIGEFIEDYDEFAALASVNYEKLIIGDELVVTSGTGAFSKNSKPTVTVDGDSAQAQPYGTFMYKTKVTTTGKYKKIVHFTYYTPDTLKILDKVLEYMDGNQRKIFHYKLSTPYSIKHDLEKVINYTVGVPYWLNLNTVKTRRFYRNIENAFRVTGSSDYNKIRVWVKSGPASISKIDSVDYVVKCSGLGIAALVVKDGKNPTVAYKIPINAVPPPTIKVGNLRPGNVTSSLFKAQTGLTAELKDFDGVSYTVTGFTFTAVGKGFGEKGNQSVRIDGTGVFNKEAREIMSKCENGSTVIISDVVVSGPNGREKLTGNVSYLLRD